MRFKVSDKVIVKSFFKRPNHWNISGGMDKWMGKIVTIRKYRKRVRNPYSIEEDKEEYRGDGWYWKESDFLPIPKPGDRVKLRTWEDMEKQYGCDPMGNINCPADGILKNDMKEYCGTVVAVRKIFSDCLSIKGIPEYLLWPFEAIEEVYPKEEKMEFTKDMLKSGEHVVEYRNGDRRLYLNDYLVGCESGNDIRFYSSDLKSKPNAEFDIMAVYKAAKGNTLYVILNYSNELIWKRDEGPIEIPATEAFAKLKEIYGKEVKIVEDKDD